MIRRTPPFLPVLVALALAAGLASVSCGGGGGGPTNPPGIAALFVGLNPTPGAMTLSMQPGPTSGSTFQVQIIVTDINDFFGTGFRIRFDSSSAVFLAVDASGSFLDGMVNDIRAEIDVNDPDALAVAATLQGANLVGVDVVGSEVLLTLTFGAVVATNGNSFTFDTPATREVQTCPAPAGSACNVVPDAGLTWSGGTMTAN